MAHAHFWRSLIARSALLALLLATVSAVAAADDQPKLGIRPVGGTGYIELTLEPGASQELAVELGNYGDQPVVASTYLADIYSLVNGGMGVRLKGEPMSGMTNWIDYPGEELTLDARTAVQRSFMLRVPADAAPGEYLASVVLQGAPTTLTTSENPVALSQVVRQAMAIAITIPGPQHAELELGAVSHRVNNGTSLLVVELRNAGNVRVRPSGELVLRDSAGAELSRYPLELGSLYAGTSTTLEVPFAGTLPEGGYSVSLSLADPSRGAQIQVADLPVHVDPAPTPEAAVAGTVPQPAPLNLPTAAPAGGSQPSAGQDAGGSQANAGHDAGATDTAASPPLSTPELIVGGLLLLGLGLALRPALRRR